ncbi:hypothetical protein WA171_002931 [Blastocystis sp. BT1]
MGSSQSREINYKTDLATVEPILKKKANKLTEEEKTTLQTFQTTYSAEVDRLDTNVKTALSVVGKKEEATVDTVMKAIADTRGLIHKARLLVKEKDKMKAECYQKAKEAALRKDSEKSKTYLLQYKHHKESADILRKRIDVMSQNLHSIQTGREDNEMVAVLKQLSTSLGSITSQIDSLSPEELHDRIENLDDYLKEIDAVDEDFIDDDVDLDDYMSALDADIATDAEKGMALPVAPVTVPSVSKSVKQVDESDISTKVVEME